MDLEEIQNLLLKDIIKINKGRVNKSYIVTYNDTKVFIKINEESYANNMFEIELYNLTTLKSFNINVPNVIQKGNNYLMLEYLDMSNNFPIDKIINENVCEKLAIQLSRIHNIRHPNNIFGYHVNGFNAKDYINNEFTDNYCQFFKQTRWKPLMNKVNVQIVQSIINIFLIGLLV